MKNFLYGVSFVGLLTVSFFVLPAAAQEKPSLTFDENGNFKIAQFTDIHYGAEIEEAKESVRLIEETLDAEKPQLAFYTGDIVTKRPILQGWDEIIAPAVERKIPWAVVFGNHDDENDVSRKEIMSHLMQKPYCYASYGPEDVKGIGNYVLEVRSRDDQAARYLIYCLDSNAYSPVKGIGKYGWFEFNQIRWYREQSAAYTTKNGDRPLPALAFFHIPLNEYNQLATTTISANPRLKLIGARGENECPGGVNGGMFAAMLECGDVMGTFVGHDHVNDYIGVLHGIALAYGRFSGTKKTTYAIDPHGARIIELNAAGERSFKTHIRLRGGECRNSVEYPKTFENP